MDPSERTYLKDVITSARVGAVGGFYIGGLYGSIGWFCDDIFRVEIETLHTRLLRMVRRTSNGGITGAAILGVSLGVLQLAQNYRMKRDFVNAAIGGFVSGATVVGCKGGSISTAIATGTALAVTFAIIDIGCESTRKDKGME